MFESPPAWEKPSGSTLWAARFRTEIPIAANKNYKKRTTNNKQQKTVPHSAGTVALFVLGRPLRARGKKPIPAVYKRIHDGGHNQSRHHVEHGVLL